MGSCIWNDIDNFIVAGLRASLMAGGDYADLPVADVQAGESFDPDHVAIPFVLVRGLQFVPGDSGPHFGEGETHWDDNQYPYEIIVYATNPVYGTARAMIKELAERVREWVRHNPHFGGLTSTRAESVIRVTPGTAAVEIRGPIGDNVGPYSAFATVDFAVFTEIL